MLKNSPVIHTCIDGEIRSVEIASKQMKGFSIIREILQMTNNFLAIILSSLHKDNYFQKGMRILCKDVNIS